VLQHCLGALGLEARLEASRQRAAARIEGALADHEGFLQPLERVQAISAADFVHRYVRRGRPVILEGAAKAWGAAGWSPEFLAEAHGHEPIILMKMAGAEMVLRDQGATHSTLGEALAGLGDGNRAYCRFLTFLERSPERLAEIDRAWLGARKGPLSGPSSLQLFIGGANTDTALHCAIGNNLFVQLHGEKTWILYAPSWAPVLRPPMTRAPYFFSDFDPLVPDYEAMPACRHLRGYRFTLKPGDVLYNPPLWWHRVQNPTVSIGLGYRWYSLGSALRASLAMSALSVLSANPPVWVVKRKQLDFTKVFTDS